MKKLKKKRKLRSYQEGGAPRDATAVNYTPIGGSNYFKKYPHTPSPGEAFNTFNQDVLSPFLEMVKGSMIPGKPVGKLLEGKAAQNYLNNMSMRSKSGERIGTKADMLQGNKYKYDAFETPWGDKMPLSTGVREEMEKINWKSKANSGSTDIPAKNRARMMEINKSYGVDPNIRGSSWGNSPWNKGISSDTREALNYHYPYEDMPGVPPKGASYPSNYKSTWDWDISPRDISKAKTLGRGEYPLEYPHVNQYGGPITDPRGQWAYPGEVTRIPSNNITMAGVNYPVLGRDNLGNQQMMQPGASYQFPGTSVTEYPMIDSPLAGKAAVNNMMAGKQAVNKNMMKEGGDTKDQFPDPVSFPEQRKNDFLKWLRETSFEQLKNDLDNTMGFDEQEIDMLKDGGHWIQKAVKGMRKDKPCTGAKFGSSSCPAGSKRYNLAKTFRKMNKQYGGTPMQQYLQKYPDRPATDTLTTGHGPYEMLDSDQFPDTTGYQRVKRTSIDQSPIYRGPEEQRRVDDLQNSFYQKYADPEWGESILDYEKWTEDQQNQLPLRKTQTQHPYYPTNKPSLQGGGSFFDPYNTDVPLDVKKLKQRNNSPYNPLWDFIPNTGQKWQPHTDMSWMDQKGIASDPNQLDYSPQQGFPQGQSWGMQPQGSAMNINSDRYSMKNVNQRASDESGEGTDGRPNWKDRWWANPDIINAGMEGATNLINNIRNTLNPNSAKNFQKKTTRADWWNPLGQGSRGDYMTNSGVFRPDQYTPVQFPGQAGFQHYQDGGEYNLSQEEINNLSDAFDVEYLD